jgi:hypothetical protein
VRFSLVVAFSARAARRKAKMGSECDFLSLLVGFSAWPATKFHSDPDFAISDPDFADFDPDFL